MAWHNDSKMFENLHGHARGDSASNRCLWGSEHILQHIKLKRFKGCKLNLRQRMASNTWRRLVGLGM